MFYSIEDLVAQAKDYPSVSELMIATEMAHGGYSRERIIETMEKNLAVMKQSVAEGIAGVTSVTGLTGGDATRLNDYIHSGNFLSGETILQAVRNAIAVNEVNAKMGLICATPTAGSAGVVSGVLLAVIDRLKLTHQQQLDFLFTAGAFGLVIANNASISGAEGGCQAECGSAAAMASAAVVEMMGGTPKMSLDAAAIVFKNILGLVCDPVAGLVEIPCAKRNSSGAISALCTADLVMAGVKSKIPFDDALSAMYKVGRSLPAALRETAQGGVAVTKAGLMLKKKVFGDN